MLTDRYIFAQLMDFLPKDLFDRCIERYHGNRGVRNFSCLDQFLCMTFAQLTYRESLRDIETCLRDPQETLPRRLPRLDRQEHPGQSQRETRLANLCGSGAGLDRAGAAAVRGRWIRRRLGANHLRAGFHHHRPVLGLVPSGQISPSQGGPSSCTRSWTCAAISPVLCGSPTARPTT